MNELHRSVMAISATLFAILLLGSLIVFGGELTRTLAMIATFCAVVSQFVGQDREAWRVHLLFSYVGMVVALIGIIALGLGH